jgi:mRNA-degrading endonuclease RelE of RelBE toxin-antitoxin system
MPFEIRIDPEAEAQIRALPARERRALVDTILAKLVDQPTTPTKAVKRLRPNPIAKFELRVGELRVLYNVEDEIVHLVVVGRKVGNKLIVDGGDYHGHQDHPPEPSGNGSAGHAE